MTAEEAWRSSHLDAEALRRALPPAGAVAALRDALTGGLDPAADPARGVLDVESGQLLTMPSAAPGAVGVKLVSIAPDNPANGLPLIQGVYVLFDPVTLAPAATIDGAALTTLRTPATSVAALLPALRRRQGALHVVVFGAGPQGVGHVATLRDVGLDVGEVTYVVRHPSRVDRSAIGDDTVVAAAEADRATSRADVIVCATSSTTPVFDSRGVRSDVVVMAVGAHEAHTREIDAPLMGRAQVIVEDVGAALSECGDVVLAIGDGVLRAEQLVPMSDVVCGRTAYADDRPVVFTGTGMSWQDLVVARAAHRSIHTL